jgi:SNF2 family DNA or RNA helicase
LDYRIYNGEPTELPLGIKSNNYYFKPIYDRRNHLLEYLANSQELEQNWANEPCSFKDTIVIITKNGILGKEFYKAYAFDKRNTIINEFLLSIREIKAFNIFDPIKNRISRSTEDYTKKYLRFELKMDDTQKEAYVSVRDTMEYGDDIDCSNGLVQLMRLQQICIDPTGLVSAYDVVAPKVQWVTEFVKKNKFQVIVFAKKPQGLKSLATVFETEGITYSMIKGGMFIAERDEETRKFKQGESQVYLIQLDAGRESLTLPEAKCTIFLDRDFAQGFNEQAEARMTPVDGSKCTKYIIDLTMSDTVEECIYDVLVMRKESIDNINTVKPYLKKGGTEDGV